jgi:hypothetical protein
MARTRLALALMAAMLAGAGLAPLPAGAGPVVVLAAQAGGSALPVALRPVRPDGLAVLRAPLPAQADGSALPDPAPEPPAPAVLPGRPAPRAPAAGFAPLPGLPPPEGGGFRWTGEAPEREVLRRLGAALADHPGRIVVEVEVSGPEADASAARRASLVRAQVVRDALAEGGRDPRRIDLRPMGRGAAGRDRVSVLPGGAGP